MIIDEAMKECEKIYNELKKKLIVYKDKIFSITDLMPIEKNDDIIRNQLISAAEEIVSKLKSEEKIRNIGFEFETLLNEYDELEFHLICNIRFCILSNPVQITLYKILSDIEERDPEYYKFEEILLNRLNTSFREIFEYELESDDIEEISIVPDYSYNEFEDILKIDIRV